MKFYNTAPEEQESVLNIDYLEKNLYVYSSRTAIIKRFYKRLGTPNRIYYVGEAVSGASWKIPFKDKNKIRIGLSKMLLLRSNEIII